MTWWDLALISVAFFAALGPAQNSRLALSMCVLAVSGLFWSISR